ncbi:hypothetical protein CSV86_011555 [Pseudomonas putida CSV86]|uniref:Uncharacterized protein n=1 Tax=Pseudomonas bharatica CSV86 TaxID=1005395 RepID=A0A7K4EDT4_9PSED|nr:hypothetical protein [Pseudomonas bharatica]NNJ15823.1 hypothetical protein [Pseudomonas bharatica CSV86]
MTAQEASRRVYRLCAYGWLRLFANAQPIHQLLFALVDRKDPNDLATGSDDTFRHTISSVFTLCASLLDEHTPDLYPVEWQMIADAQMPSHGRYRLPSSLPEMKSKIIVGVEDLTGRDGDINSVLLANKLAGFSSAQLCAIAFHVQLYHVARKRGSEFQFPTIRFKG